MTLIYGLYEKKSGVDGVNEFHMAVKGGLQKLLSGFCPLRGYPEGQLPV